MAGEERSFGPYRLAGRYGPLWRGNDTVPLTAKTVAVLWELVRRAGQVVTKEELLAAVWGDTVVSEEVLTTGIRTLRRELGDEVKQPRYIQTVHRIGYRFLPAVTTPPLVQSSTFQVPRPPPRSASDVNREERASLLGTWNLEPETFLVGRETELAQLHQLFAKARHGARQIVFVTGEAGRGKTALVDTFLASIRQQATGDRQQRSADLPLRLPDARSLMPEVWVGWGQCIEHYGAGEAYLPVLAAVSGLCQQAAGEQVLSVLRRVAPTWLVQLPALVEETDYAALQPKVAGATRERMLREMAEALEALSTERPLLLVLEDMHWSDVSTIDLLNLLARRRETARLLVLVTYRPAEVIISEHPLKQVKQELVTRGYGAEVVMGRLDVESVQQYVHQRAPDPAREADLATLVYQRTEGHPLFMVQMTEYLTQQEADGALPATRLEEVERLLPQQLRDLLAAQLGRLTAEEQAILETASVAGVEFTVASVAVGGAFTEEAVEATCEQLAQRGQFLSEREVAPWPDGTVSGRYGFRHALYQEVLYQRLSASRRARLHRQIGEREEAGYGERAHEIAAELAQHFEQGHEFHRAVAYLQKAADTALQRNAYAEAIGLLTRALALLQTWPDTAARNHQELTLQLALGESLMMHKGYSAPEAERAYTRALALCQVNTPSQLRFNVLTGLASLWIARGNFRRARELAEEGLTLAQQVESLPQQLQAQLFLGVACCYLGEPVLVHEYLAPGVMLYETQAQDATLEADETELVV